MPRKSKRRNDSEEEDGLPSNVPSRVHDVTPSGVFVTVGGKRETETEMAELGSSTAIDEDDDADIDSEEAYDEDFDGVGVPMGSPQPPDTVLREKLCLCIIFLIVGGLLVLGVLYLISGGQLTTL